MELLNNKKKNQWQAPPLTHYETVYVNKEKTNENVPPQAILIDFQPTEALIKSGVSYLSLKITMNE